MYFLTYAAGNVANRSFANPERYSEICYMPFDLVRDYSFLLKALTCGRDIDPDLYDLRAIDYMQRFYANDDLNWNWFSVTVHGVLGSLKIKHFIINIFECHYWKSYPIPEHGAHTLRAMPANPGALSEQPAEANWRWVRKFREHFTPQTSIQASLQYPFIRKMEMADPEILSINKPFVEHYR